MSDPIKITTSHHKRHITETWDAVLKHGSVVITKRGSKDMILMTTELHEALMAQAKVGEVVCDEHKELTAALKKSTRLVAKGRLADDGWIDWSGGDNPVPGKRVYYELRWGSGSAGPSNALRWHHSASDSELDIIRYRVIEGATS